jgi:hypothetical protein
MDEEELLNLITPALEAIEGINELRVVRSGIRLEMYDGSRWRLRIESLDDEDDA